MNSKNGYAQSERWPAATACRGIRGAITVARNDASEILSATRELLQAIVQANQMQPDDIASVYFTTTSDLNATYPALAARQLGWYDVALLCGHEMDVPGSLDHCIRVLIHWNTTKSARDIVHVYLRDAVSLRPDRKELPPITPIRPRQIDAIEAMMRVLQAAV
ncbi:MAG TPA: chorismate mutase [Chloroflexota bacterium]|nr:chorismate mutase [Chloroflexota bacterium]HUM70866.1 chorismate mutase [Chloroflexota bacterium]